MPPRTPGRPERPGSTTAGQLINLTSLPPKSVGSPPVPDPFMCLCMPQVRLLVAKDGQAFTSMLKGQKDFGNPELLDKVPGHAVSFVIG